MFLEEEKEPTEHILNEMMEQEEAFAGYAEQIIFVVRSKEALETPTLSKALAKLKSWLSDAGLGFCKVRDTSESTFHV